MKNGKWLALLLALMLSLSMISTTAFADSDAWDGRTQEEFSGGDGTAESPYQIANGAQFYFFTQNCQNAYYELTDDIDLGNQPFPIIKNFAGVLDGKGKAIVNLSITSDTYRTSMIGSCTGTVRNLSVYGTVVSTAQQGSVAAIACDLKESGRIKNCQNYCTVKATGDNVYVGGIVGSMHNGGQILDCANFGEISGLYAGGIVGTVYGGHVGYVYLDLECVDDVPSITGCLNMASISGRTVGGICAYQQGTTISECANTGKITGKSYAGGIVGSAYALNCQYAHDDGVNYYQQYPTFIHDCYNTGEIAVLGTESFGCGGIAGSFIRCTRWDQEGIHTHPEPTNTCLGLKNCYNIGKVTTETSQVGPRGYSGDINGYWSSNAMPEPKGCLYLSGINPDVNSNISEFTKKNGGAECSESQLEDQSSYISYDFDFDSTWEMDDSGTYPYAILKRVGLPVNSCDHKYKLTENTATCLEDGTATYTCIKCGDSYTESVAATGHSFTTKASSNKATDATCTAAATYYVRCDNCDAVSNSVTVPVGDANGHSPAAAVRENEVAATCAAAGSYDEVVYCSVCNAEISRTQKTIDKLQHDFGNNLEYCKNGCGTKNPNYVPPYNPPHKPSVKPNPTPSKPETPENPFVDVKKDDYYYDAVIWAVGKGIAKGVTDTTFQPNASCTRAEMVTFLYRAAGSPEPTNKVNPFTDVAEDSYYYKAVLWAVEKGIAKGTSETTFSPNDTCTRGQTVAFLYRYANSPAVSGSNSFADVSETAYYYNATLWAMSEKVTEGTSATTFSPNDLCTRGQIVTFLYRYMGK